MPHALSLTDGITTVSLSTTNVILEYFVPKTPKRFGPGELDFAPVEEAIEVACTGISTTAIQTIYNGVQILLLAAARRQASGIGARVFLQYQPIGDATLWRTEVLDGDASLADSAMTTFGSLIMKARLLIRRRPWWEGVRTQIPLTNGNGTNNTSGLSILNHDDSGGGHDNYVGISASSVAGVLPTPLELSYTNTNGTTVSINSFYLANNRFDVSFSHMIEGEDSTSGTTGSTASASSGQYLILSGTGTLSASFALSASLLQKTEGRFVHLLARMPFLSSSPIYARAEIRDGNGLVILAAGREVTLSSTSLLQNLGTLPLPPGGYNTAYGALTLRLLFRVAVSSTINLDYVQLTPADELCYRYILALDTGHENNCILVDDGIEGVTYKTLSGNNSPIYAPWGRPLHVFPGVNQRIYTLFDGVGATIARTLSVKAFYRPRRLTI